MNTASFGFADLQLTDRWKVVALQNKAMGWEWVLDAIAAEALVAARDAGRAVTAQQRDQATRRMVLLAKLAGTA